VREYLPQVGFKPDDVDLEKIITVHEVKRNPRHQFGFFMQEKFTFNPIRVVKGIYIEYCNYCKHQKENKSPTIPLTEFIKECEARVSKESSEPVREVGLKMTQPSKNTLVSYQLGIGFTYDE